MFTNLFSNRAMLSHRIPWRRVLEDSHVMMSRFRTVILSLSDGLNKEQCIAAHLFWKACKELAHRSGWLFLALYLKQARVCLQKYVAQDSDRTTLSPAVSLTRCGLPRIIPSFHRRKIREGHALTIQLYMSFFTVSRLIPLAKKIDKSLFTSIVSPMSVPFGDYAILSRKIENSMGRLFRRYIPRIGTIPLEAGVEYRPVWKSVPTWVAFKSYMNIKRVIQKRLGAPVARAPVPSIFTLFYMEFEAFSFLVFAKKREWEWTFENHGLLWGKTTRFAFDHSPWDTSVFVDKVLPFTVPQTKRVTTGRLCATCYGDGKRRVFAIGNYFIQRLLYPVHKWLMSCLRTIPMDGTFDQTAPLDRLANASDFVASVDLKSATDRWPLLLQKAMLEFLFGFDFANSVATCALGVNFFEPSFTKWKSYRDGPLVRFATGQPLGYLASWPLFALSHHLVVWYAAEQEYPGALFDKYAILGDDVVIADERVSRRYKTLISRLGVEISHSKSLTSKVGVCEFAKRLRINRMQTDVSPVSLRKVADVRSPLGRYSYVITIPKALRLSTLLRISGLGFKACSRPIYFKRHGKRARRLLAMLLVNKVRVFSIRVMLSVLLGHWISPNHEGRLIQLLFKKFEPKDLVLPPDEAYLRVSEKDLVEVCLVDAWMRQYLVYLKWYCTLIMGPVSLDDFFKAPVYCNTWYKKHVDGDINRFGLSFIIVELAKKVCKE